MSGAATAYPSTAELSLGGTSKGARMSSARTRSSASTTGTSSGDVTFVIRSRIRIWPSRTEIMAGIIARVIRPKPGGFWRRVVAALVDIAVFLVVKASFTKLAMRVGRVDVEGDFGVRGTLVGCTVLFAVFYLVVLHALEGQTIGKLLVRVRVVGADGAPPTFGTSVLRLVAYVASFMPFGLGFVMAGLRADRRALHDLLAGTRVERVSPPVTSAL